jgi:hypothetical protein
MDYWMGFVFALLLLIMPLEYRNAELIERVESGCKRVQDAGLKALRRRAVVAYLLMVD